MEDNIRSANPPQWETTRLWGVLKKRTTSEVEPIRTTLKQCMPKIETVLSKGGTAPTDFTLHDADHSHRVAERMAEVIPSDVLEKLTCYELALLLLAAYLHDIGMTPQQGKVRNHYNYLLTGERGALGSDEIAGLQKWIDNENREVAIPLCTGKPTTETLNLAVELMTYYCRHRHNDWSADWIRKELANLTLGTYAGWDDDLVVLCKSHHEGFHELRGQRFDPRYVGSPARIVHLRYLACALRIADVLDIDPERTPEVIMRHRNVAPNSFIYWWKDHQISILQQGNRLLVSARPPDAQVHRAIEITGSQIEEELRLCRRLADETHFEKYPGPATSDLPHRWPLLADIHRDISPRDDRYEYIDGAFRPNTRKLLSLLSGPELYGSPLVGVRELLQNAFDAVREQVAYERLNQPNPSDPSHELTFGEQNHVDLSIECCPDGEWLVCTDTGVGMSKTVIQNHVLVSGTPKRHDVLDLERRCSEAGFSLGRTGEFGIGVLSYFMLADRVVIRTRRSQHCPDAEAYGWQFETEGIGSFGELRKLPDRTRGTEVRLHLRTGLLGKTVSGSIRRLATYVRGVLVRVPCRFHLSPVQGESDGFDLSPGWTHTADDFSNKLITELFEQRNTAQSLGLLPAVRRKELEDMKHYREQVRGEAERLLRWEVQEGTLPDGIGVFRFHLPYFLLHGGASLGYMRVRKVAREFNLEKVGGQHVFKLSEHLFAWSFGWKGVSIQARDPSGRNSIAERIKRLSTGYVEIDFTGAAENRVRVSRAEVALSPRSIGAIRWLDRRIGQLCEGFLDRHLGSEYATLNCRILGSGYSRKRSLHWLVTPGDFDQNRLRWKQLTLPLVNEAAITVLKDRVETFKVRFRGKDVCPASPLAHTTYSSLEWYTAGMPLDKLVVSPTYWLKVVPLWDALRPHEVSAQSANSCRFPPGWRRVCGVLFDEDSALGFRMAVWNLSHPLFRSVDSEGLRWCDETFGSPPDPLPHKTALLSQNGRCAGWVMKCFDTAADGLWNGLKERDPSFLTEIFSRIFGHTSEKVGSSKPELIQWVEQSPYSFLRVVSPDGWTVYSTKHKNDLAKIEHYLPDPGPNWRLEVKVTEKDDSRGASQARGALSSVKIPKVHWWNP